MNNNQETNPGQPKSRILSQSRDELADKLLHLQAEIESTMETGFPWHDQYRLFVQTFKDLVPRTRDEKCVSQAKVDNKRLVDCIEKFFADPKNRQYTPDNQVLKDGLALSRLYYRALKTGGILSDQD